MSLPACSLIRHERWAMRGGRAAEVGTRARRRLTPELLEGKTVLVEGEADLPHASGESFSMHQPQPLTTAPTHSSQWQKMTVKQIYGRRGLFPLHSTALAKLIYIQRNEVAERRAARGGGNGGAKWRKLGGEENEEEPRWQKGQTNYPCRGHIYFSTRNTQTCNKIITIQ